MWYRNVQEHVETTTPIFFRNIVILVGIPLLVVAFSLARYEYYGVYGKDGELA